MSEINTGGPAFPLNWPNKGEFWAYGITARDYFAAKAMQALIAEAPSSKDVAEATNTLAHFAYTIADAMLKAREQ